MGRVQGFDIARGVAAVLVVAYHLTTFLDVTVNVPQPVSRMGLLMLISGAVAAPAMSKDWTYSRDRALDLLWLVLLWTPLVLLADRGVAGLAAMPRELIAPSTPLWYISGLALLVMSAPLFCRVHPAVPLSLAAAGMLWHVAGGQTGVTGYDQMLHFTLFFYIGLYSRATLIALLERCESKTGWAAAAGLIAMMVLPVPHRLGAIVAIALLLITAQGLSDSRAGQALSWLGRRTPDIYLAHTPLLIIARRLLGPIGPGMFVLLTVGIIATCLALRAIADEIGLDWLYRRPRLLAVQWLAMEEKAGRKQSKTV